ncbi:MAG: TIR domain-containing protein [Thermodesulfobacteriota bacterium]
MPASEVFISHATADDGFVATLRIALESLRIPVWVDSRSLRGGEKLAPAIEEAIAAARQVLVPRTRLPATSTTGCRPGP